MIISENLVSENIFVKIFDTIKKFSVSSKKINLKRRDAQGNILTNKL